MNWVIRMLLKAKKIDPTDIMNQMGTDDLIQLIKELI